MRAHFRALFEDADGYLALLLGRQLLQPDRRTQARRARRRRSRHRIPLFRVSWRCSDFISFSFLRREKEDDWGTDAGMSLAQRLDQFGENLEQVTDEAVIGDLKDRRLFILVDGDDDFAVLHAGEMLDGAGNADRDVQLRRDDLAGLPDLRSLGTKPASTAAREAPTAAPSLSANWFSRANSRPIACRGRPTRYRALVSSGRSDLGVPPDKAREAGTGRGTARWRRCRPRRAA